MAEKRVGAMDRKPRKSPDEFKSEYGELQLDEYGESPNVGDTNSKQRGGKVINHNRPRKTSA